MRKEDESQQNIEIVELLLKYGAYVNLNRTAATDPYENKETTLHLAVNNGNYDLVKLLIIYKQNLPHRADVFVQIPIFFLKVDKVMIKVQKFKNFHLGYGIFSTLINGSVLNGTGAT